MERGTVPFIFISSAMSHWQMTNSRYMYSSWLNHITELQYIIDMNDTEKLKKILNNVIDKQDGINFYHIEIDGELCTYFRKGGRIMYLETPNSGKTICVNDIQSVSFDDDVYFAVFHIDGIEYGLNIMKDMSPSQILDELA